MKKETLMFVPRWDAASATKTLLYAASILAAPMSFPGLVQAIHITNVTTDTTLFFDNFENQTAGAAPTTDNMTPGASGSSWTTARGGTGSTRNVINTPRGTTFPPDAPGPYQGSNYLLLDIPRNSFGYTASATASFTQLPAGDTLEISFAYTWGTGGTTITVDVDEYTGNGSGGPQLKLQGGDGISVFMDSSDGFFHFYGPDDGYDQPIASSTTAVKGALGEWHTFLLNWTQGSSDVTLTVDGITEVITGALNGDAPTWFPSDLNISTTREGVIAYDAIPTALEGDNNHNGVVDSADYVVWRKDPGAFAPNAYDVWWENFGAPGSSGSAQGGGSSLSEGSAVPEPTSFLLIALSALTFGMAGTGRSRRIRERLKEK